ncbi:hypothetical protein ACFLQL_00520 [Verrucomicrobiota bacterium]
MHTIIKQKDGKLRLAHPKQIEDIEEALDTAKTLACKDDNCVFYVCRVVNKVFSNIQVEKCEQQVNK